MGKGEGESEWNVKTGRGERCRQREEGEKGRELTK